jgi:hypothetical protein
VSPARLLLQDREQEHSTDRDNALAENLWSTIKIELIYWPGTSFATRTEAEMALFRYLDGWYNPRRIQQGLGGLSPEEYERSTRRPGTPNDKIDPSRLPSNPTQSDPDNQVSGEAGEPHQGLRGCTCTHQPACYRGGLRLHGIQ